MTSEGIKWPSHLESRLATGQSRARLSDSAPCDQRQGPGSGDLSVREIVCPAADDARGNVLLSEGLVVTYRQVTGRMTSQCVQFNPLV